MLPPSRGASRPTGRGRGLRVVDGGGSEADGGRTATGPTAAAPSASQRARVDYGLARRATLQQLLGGRASTTDVCDAHPYLLRAAKHHGEPSGTLCPVCRRVELAHVTYVYGDELGQYSGRIRTRPELEVMAREHGEFRVYVVEVCSGCGWNHLTTSYVMGDGVPRRPPRRQRTVEDD